MKNSVRISSGARRSRSALFLLTLFVYLGIAAVPVAKGAAPAGARELKVLELSGTPYARGLQHGRSLRTEIGKVVLLWKEDAARQARSDPDMLIRDFLACTDYLPAIRKW